MNQGMLAAMVAVFLVPVGVVVCLNFDQISGHDPDARPQGTLIYFYANW